VFALLTNLSRRRRDIVSCVEKSLNTKIPIQSDVTQRSIGGYRLSEEKCRIFKWKAYLGYSKIVTSNVLVIGGVK